MAISAKPYRLPIPGAAATNLIDSRGRPDKVIENCAIYIKLLL